MKHQIYVTQEDISKSVVAAGFCFPVGLAMSRAFPDDLTSIGPNNRFYVNNRNIKLPDFVSEMVEDYNLGNDMEPFSFEVETDDERYKWTRWTRRFKRQNKKVRVKLRQDRIDARCPNDLWYGSLIAAIEDLLDDGHSMSLRRWHINFYIAPNALWELLQPVVLQHEIHKNHYNWQPFEFDMFVPVESLKHQE